MPIEIGGPPIVLDVGPEETVELRYDYDGVGRVELEVLDCAGPYEIVMFFAHGGLGGSQSCTRPFHGPVAPHGPTGNVIEFSQWQPTGDTRSYTVRLQRVDTEVGRGLFPGAGPVEVSVPEVEFDPERGNHVNTAWLGFFGAQGQSASVSITANECLWHVVRLPDNTTEALCPSGSWSRTLPQTGRYRVEVVAGGTTDVQATVRMTASRPIRCADSGVVPVLLAHGLGGHPSDFNGMRTFLRARLKEEFQLEGFSELQAASCATQAVSVPFLAPQGSSSLNAAILNGRINNVLRDLDAERLDIIAHSKGGLDSRVAATLRADDAIRNITMIATPNAGTPLADVGCGVSLGSLVHNNLIYDLGRRLLEDRFGQCFGPEDALWGVTETFVQNVLNRRTPDMPQTTYQTLAGASNCGFCRALHLLMGENDVLVPVTSVQRFAPRHGVIGTFGDEHADLLRNSDVHWSSYCHLRGRELYRPPACAPHIQSVPKGREVANIDGDAQPELFHFDAREVTADDSATSVLPIGGAGPIGLVMLTDRPGLTATVGGSELEVGQGPGGEVHTAVLENASDVELVVSNPTGEDATVLALLVAQTPQSLEVEVTPEVAAPGESVELRVPGLSPDEELLGAVVEPGGEAELAFTSDGADAVATYTPPDSGEYPVTITHSGDRRRTAVGRVVAGSGGASLPGTFTESTETDPDGLVTTLHLDVPVEVHDEGTYELNGRLTTANGAEVATTDAPETFLAEGQHTLRLSISGADLHAAGEDGPYHIDVLLSRRHSATAVSSEAQAIAATPTASYLVSDFQPAAVSAGFAVVEQPGPGTAEAHVPVRLSESISRPVTVGYEVEVPPGSPPGTEPVLGTVDFAAGQTSRTIPVTIPGVPDQSEDYLVGVELRDPTNAIIDGALGGVWVVVEPPAMIESPPSGTTWSVGDEISFSGGVDDPVHGELPASALTWQLLWHDCTADPASCIVRIVDTQVGVAAGSFVAPDVPYPSHLELLLTAEGPSGATYQAARELHPETFDVTVITDPPGLEVAASPVGGVLTPQTAPLVVTVTHGTLALFLRAPSSQTVDGVTYVFDEWVHGGPRGQWIPAPSTAVTYTAAYIVDNVAGTRPVSVRTTGGRSSPARWRSWTGRG